ncbi:hypothetical protein R3P38DRAFT_2899015 [Favolaschia claudopus]|uniref:Uncharacterized protein n=1 Tax=Favolaschia claudopus TaxID=2862362 RepID=A0AAW0CK08_9AGAR
MHMPNPVDDYPAGTGAIKLPLDGVSETRSRSSKLRRAIWLTVLYTSIALACCSLLILSYYKNRSLHNNDEAPLISPAEDSRLEPYQTPENAHSCADWSENSRDWHSFELPPDAHLLFLLSRGPGIYGEVNIIKTSQYSRGPIEVNITAEYETHTDLLRTKLCRMGSATEHGILLWADPYHPHGASMRSSVRFNITVALPTGVRDYKDITTDLAHFSHHVGDFFDIWSPTSFDVIRLKSSNAEINHGALIGRAGFFETSNSDVRGFFGGFDYEVKTSNAQIQATAFMFGESTGSEARVKLQTSNGEIVAALGLTSDFSDSTLRAVVETSNAAITLSNPKQGMMPDNVSFFLDASTSNAPAQLHLFPEYEGPYDLQTTQAAARVKEISGAVPDPAGKGRHRTVTKTGDGSSHAQGKVYWSHDGNPPEGFERGHIKITTSVSPIELHI